MYNTDEEIVVFFFSFGFFFSLDILSRKIKELFSINSARARPDFSVWCCSSHNVNFGFEF